MSTGQWTPMSADYRDIRWWSPETNEWRMILPAAGYAPRYAGSGYLVYARAGGLRAVAFDLERLEVTGEPVPVLGDVRVDSQFAKAQFAVAENGSLFYIYGGDVGVGVPAWVDRQGSAELLPMPEATYGMFRLSPDGTRLAAQVGGASDQVWIYDVTTGSGTRLTTSGNNGWPVWRGDEQVVYASREADDTWTLSAVNANGGGLPDRLFTDSEFVLPWSWSPAYDVISLSRGNEIDETVFLSLDDGTTESNARTGEWGHEFSPDGRWLAYSSLRDGPYEVFVSPYPALDREFKVSVGGGTEPLWSSDGSEIVYHNGNRWMVSRVSYDGGFSSATPQELFETSFVDSAAVSWDIAPDDRFLLVKPTAEESDPTEVRIVLNWSEELNALAPTR